MSRTNGYRLSVMIFAMAVCLTMPACRTSKEKACDANEVSASSDAVQDTISKLKETIIPEMMFYSPATIVDAVDFFKKASRDCAKPGTPPEQRGVSFVLDLHPAVVDPFTAPVDPFATSTNDAPPQLAAISVRVISLYDALQLVCEVTDIKWHISEFGAVMLTPKVLPHDQDCFTRSYNIPNALADSLLHNSDEKASSGDPNKVWQEFFEQLGVKGPSLDRFEYMSSIGKLRVTSTRENLEIIGSVFDQFAMRMVEVEMQIHAFRTTDIERLRLSGGVSLESLMALRQNGQAKPVASATALTKSGHESIVKAVQEVNYPTELVTDIQTGSNVTSRSAVNALMPGNFTMRETGMILQVVPEVIQKGQQINLTLRPQWVTLEGWESYPASMASGWRHNTLFFKQPIFGVTSFETQAVVKDGGTVLVGSCSTPDGEWVQAGFLTARFVDRQAKVPDKKVLQQKARGDAEVLQKLKHIVIPELTFHPPATIIDAMRFFQEASLKYDKSTAPETQRGLNFVLKLPPNWWYPTGSSTNVDPFAASSATNRAPVIAALNARFITLYDALKLVCDVTGMLFRIRDGVVWVIPESASCDGLITRIYAVPPSGCERVSTDASSRGDDNNTPDWRAFFMELGVNWPVGSSISVKNLDSVVVLRVTNTLEFLGEFEQVLEELSVFPRMVEVDVQIHAFSTEEIELLRLSGDMSVETLMALRKAGRGNPIASAMVVTKSGQEAIVKAVREMLYPAELSNTSGEGAGALKPSSFEMREVGMILQVTPEIAATEQPQVHLTIKPQWVTLEGWESYPAAMASVGRHKTLPFKKPLFRITSFESQVLVNAGKTVLLGSSSTPDGKWVHVGFLTVK